MHKLLTQHTAVDRILLIVGINCNFELLVISLNGSFARVE